MALDEQGEQFDGVVVLVDRDVDFRHLLEACPHGRVTLDLAEVVLRLGPAMVQFRESLNQVLERLQAELDLALLLLLADGLDDLLEGVDRAAEFAQVVVDPAQLVERVVEHRRVLEVLRDALVVHLGQGQVVGLEEMLGQIEVRLGDVLRGRVLLHQLVQVLHALVGKHLVAQGLALLQRGVAQAVQHFVQARVARVLLQDLLVVFDGLLVVLDRLRRLGPAARLRQLVPRVQLLHVFSAFEQPLVVGLLPPVLGQAKDQVGLDAVVRRAVQQSLRGLDDLLAQLRLLELELLLLFREAQRFQTVVVEAALLQLVVIDLLARRLDRLHVLDQRGFLVDLLGPRAGIDVFDDLSVDRQAAQHAGQERH